MNIGNEVFVSYEVAKLLQEKGFNWPTVPFYDIKRKVFYSREDNVFQLCDWYNTYPERMFYSAPTQQMACEWLRQTAAYHIEIRAAYHFRVFDGYTFEVFNLSSEEYVDYANGKGVFSTANAACEAGIRFCLEILPRKED